MLLGARQFFERRGAPTPPLPYDAEVEYLESAGNGSTGGQFIVSGVLIPHDCTHVRYGFKFEFKSFPKGVLCGHQTVSYANPRTYLFYKNAFNTVRDFYAGDKLGSIDVPVGETFTGEAILDEFSETLVILRDGEVVFSHATSGAFLNRDFPIVFFGGSHGTSFDDAASVKIFYFKIWHGNNLVRDFQPVRLTNELGQSEGAMYDRVSGQVFRNAGTGAFTIGPDKS